MTKVSIGEVLSDLWADLSGAQKFVLVALVALIAIALIGSWVNTFQTWSEIRVYEKAAIEAQRDKAAALEHAAKIASDIKIREEALAKVEEKRNEKELEVKRGAVVVGRDRAEYERAVRERRQDVPSTKQLCDELAALGYPCQPTQ
jgi:hypothetical protein